MFSILSVSRKCCKMLQVFQPCCPRQNPGRALGRRTKPMLAYWKSINPRGGVLQPWGQTCWATTFFGQFLAFHCGNFLWEKIGFHFWYHYCLKRFWASILGTTVFGQFLGFHFGNFVWENIGLIHESFSSFLTLKPPEVYNLATRTAVYSHSEMYALKGVPMTN